VSARRIAASIGWSVGLVALVGAQGCTDTVTPAPPIPFRQRAPISNYRVPTSRPTLRWFTPQPQLDHTVTICADRDCRRVEETITVRGNSAQPARNLSRGVHFWRVTSRWENADRVTPVWQFRSTWDTDSGPRGADRGDAADYNGDGYSDIALLTNDPRVEILYGGDGGLGSSFVDPGASSVPDRVSTILGAADLDGDGFDDLAMGLPAVGRDRVVVFYGSAQGLSDTRRVEVTSGFPMGTWFVASTVKSPRRADLDQDGVDDLLLRAGPAPDGVHYLQGNAVLWHEGGRLVVARPDGTRPTEQPIILLPVVPADINLDAIPDLVVHYSALRHGSTMGVIGTNYFGPMPLRADRFVVPGSLDESLRPFPLPSVRECVTVCDLQHDRVDDTVLQAQNPREEAVVRFEGPDPFGDEPGSNVPASMDTTCFHGEDREYLFVRGRPTATLGWVTYRPDRSTSIPFEIPIVTNLSFPTTGIPDSCRTSTAHHLRAANQRSDIQQSVLFEVDCNQGTALVTGLIRGTQLEPTAVIHRDGLRDYFL
jgi:hypothetical protein